jgi:hypothetical protein
VTFICVPLRTQISRSICAFTHYSPAVHFNAALIHLDNNDDEMALRSLTLGKAVRLLL